MLTVGVRRQRYPLRVVSPGRPTTYLKSNRNVSDQLAALGNGHEQHDALAAGGLHPRSPDQPRADGRAVTRPALSRRPGSAARSSTQRVQQAIDVGLLEDGDLAPSAGGRPSRLLRFRAEAGHVYAGLDRRDRDDGRRPHPRRHPRRLAARGLERGRPAGGDSRRAGRAVRPARHNPRTEPWAFGIGVGDRWTSRPGGSSTRRSCRDGTAGACARGSGTGTTAPSGWTTT